MARANWKWSNNHPALPTFRPEPCTAESEEERIVEAMQHLQGALVTCEKLSGLCSKESHSYWTHCEQWPKRWSMTTLVWWSVALHFGQVTGESWTLPESSVHSMYQHTSIIWICLSRTLMAQQLLQTPSYRQNFVLLECANFGVVCHGMPAFIK